MFGVESNFVLAAMSSNDDNKPSSTSTNSLPKSSMNDPSVFAKSALREQSLEILDELSRISRSFLKGTGVSEVITQN
jgi:hypothetical protein